MTKKQYNIKISKYFDKETDCSVLELSVSKELTDLIKMFIVNDEDSVMKSTSWGLKPTIEDDDSEDYLKRYLIKGVLKNSIRWSNVFDLLFTESLINHQKIKVPLMSVRMFTDVQTTISDIKELVSVMEKLNSNKEYNVTIKVE